MKIRPRKWMAALAALAVFAVAGALLSATTAPQRAEAASLAEFDPGFIISDSVFFDENAMGEWGIQSFLRGQTPSCAQSLGHACLANYSESTTSRAASTRCAAYAGAASEPASRIIDKVAKACGVNPQVILVTLQKERGLITKGSPSSADYKVAMGYGCPDTAACDSLYFGFFNQVYSAASQFIRYGVNPTTWRYRVGNVAVQFHPNAACGSTTVNIRNQATANLYNYTPYQPNAAALAAGYGTGDGCSSYGNRNFFNYFSDWFGSPVGKINPFGSVDAVVGSLGSIYVAGWAVDPDSSQSLEVHAYVDGVGSRLMADQPRPDVASTYPAAGAAHGYAAAIPVGGGSHSVCLYAINVGPGGNTELGCRTVSTPGGPPQGVIDSVTVATDGITVAGWALDPDTAVSIPVHVYVDSSSVAITADKPRPDLAASFPGYGTNHGYSSKVAATPGPHEVCLYAINVAGAQSPSSLGCRQVTVPSPAGTIPELGRKPIGIVDSVVATVGSLTIAGWALDQDTAASIPVHVYVDSASVEVKADQSRPDIAASYPGYGANHGFSKTISAAPGNHQVCAYAINTAAGGNTLISCRQVSVPAPPNVISEQGRVPIGVFDSVTTGPGSLTVAGWALDPDTAASIPVHVYIDSASSAVLADQSRPDLEPSFPGYGAGHGFSKTFTTTAGLHRVCVYAINSGPGASPLISCKNVTVPPSAPTGIVEAGRAPIGVIDSATVSNGSIVVAGWALDPDTADSISVHVYVDSASVAVSADQSRPDVAASYSGYGANHGFTATLAATSGSHQVCAYAINTGAGGNPQLSCRVVTVP
jgi:hypothetical protein